jgi:hypothetical protein
MIYNLCPNIEPIYHLARTSRIDEIKGTSRSDHLRDDVTPFSTPLLPVSADVVWSLHAGMSHNHCFFTPAVTYSEERRARGQFPLVQRRDEEQLLLTQESFLLHV